MRLSVTTLKLRQPVSVKRVFVFKAGDLSFIALPRRIKKKAEPGIEAVRQSRLILTKMENIFDRLFFLLNAEILRLTQGNSQVRIFSAQRQLLRARVFYRIRLRHDLKIKPLS